MKREGFLDDIEELVDNFSTKKRNKINKDVRLDMLFAEQRKQDDYKDKILQAIARERNLEQRSLENSDYKRELWKCDCGIMVDIFYVVENRRPPGWAFDPPTILDYARLIDEDHFHCPKCQKEIRVIGKIKGLKINMEQ